ncbi:Outer membrane protein [Elusimicrobium minutum Pei191]|uniref:Outer membrane protein n=1 Tax=Elusimicrobium minutum (strain Pei191) TaxID=445932 RepID=B2KD69_ELUMP|nr:efflux transporter outer membrane subunit [Elusimicrobium minutum]ACC98465.1 Outer membrane protein [Elusimicrobium minutum Pei191]
MNINFVLKKIFILLFLLAAGCNFAAKNKLPETDLPNQYKIEDYSVFDNEKWWEIFEDPTLNMLEETALEYNKNLVIAFERVNMARAEAGIISANSMPQIGFNVGGMRSGGYRVRTNNRFSAGVGASYEIDLWGRQRNLQAAMKARLLSREAQKDVVRLTITADVAKTYFTILAYDSILAKIDAAIKDKDDNIALHKSKFLKNASTELSLRRLEAEKDNMKAIYLEYRIALSANETALSTLIGGSAREIIEESIPRERPLEKMAVVEKMLSQVPSSILHNRPDIRVAEMDLYEAGANIGVIRAGFFPSISLTTATVLVSESMKRLFSGGTWNFAGIITGPIFQGGRNRFKLEELQAQQRILVSTYELTVQKAFKETYDAITSNNINHEILATREREVVTLNRSVTLARKSYLSKKITLTDLLEIQRRALDADIDLSLTLRNQLYFIVDICKTLGGGLRYDHAPGEEPSDAKPEVEKEPAEDTDKEIKK